MKTLALAFAIAIVLTATGCAAPGANPPASMATKYSSAEHAAYAAGGKATINGQAFMRQRGGGTVTCAGEPVMVLPATAYFREMVSLYARGQLPANAEMQGAIREVGKKSQCDAQGNFTFTNMAPGSWLVFTEVKWTVGQYNRQGGPVLKTVEARDGETTRAILSNEDRYP